MVATAPQYVPHACQVTIVSSLLDGMFGGWTGTMVGVISNKKASNSFEIFLQFLTCEAILNVFKNDRVIAVVTFQLWVSLQHKMWCGSVYALYTPI